MDPRKQKRLGPAPIASFEKSFEDNASIAATATATAAQQQQQQQSHDNAAAAAATTTTTTPSTTTSASSMPHAIEANTEMASHESNYRKQTTASSEAEAEAPSISSPASNAASHTREPSPTPTPAPVTATATTTAAASAAGNMSQPTKQRPPPLKTATATVTTTLVSSSEGGQPLPLGIGGGAGGHRGTATLMTPSTPRIELSRASSSSHHEEDSRESSPENVFDQVGTGTLQETIGLGFREEGALELRSSTEELYFMDPEQKKEEQDKLLQQQQQQQPQQQQQQQHQQPPQQQQQQQQPQQPKRSSPHIFKYDDHQSYLQQHQRKDSASSEVAALLCISGRTSRISSVGSQGSAVSRLSAVSGVSRSPSPHRMLLETSFCGPKPLDGAAVGAAAAGAGAAGAGGRSGNVPAPSALSAEHATTAALLEQVLLARKHDPTQVVLAEGIKVETSPLKKAKPTTLSNGETKLRASTLSSATSAAGAAKPGVGTGALTMGAQRRSTKSPGQMVVGKTPSGTEYIRINLKPDHMYSDKGIASNERVVEAPNQLTPVYSKSQSQQQQQQKPASLSLQGRNVVDEHRLTPTVSPKPARHGFLGKEAARGSRSPSPATISVSRKSSFSSLFRLGGKDSPDSPRERSRSRSKSKDRQAPQSQNVTPSKQKSVLAIFKPGKRGSSAGTDTKSSKSSSPIDGGYELQLHQPPPPPPAQGMMQTQPQTQRSRTPVITASGSRPNSRLRYYDEPVEGVIHIPLHTPPEEKEARRLLQGIQQLNAEPIVPAGAPITASDLAAAAAALKPVGQRKSSAGATGGGTTTTTTATAVTTAAMAMPPRPQQIQRIENLDAIHSLPQDDDNKERTWSLEVNRHSSQDSQETVNSEGSYVSAIRVGTRPSQLANVKEHVVQENGMAAGEAAAEIHRLPSVDSTMSACEPRIVETVATVNAISDDAVAKERRRLLFATRIGSGSQEQIFSTQFSISKTESQSSQLSEQVQESISESTDGLQRQGTVIRRTEEVVSDMGTLKRLSSSDRRATKSHSTSEEEKPSGQVVAAPPVVLRRKGSSDEQRHKSRSTSEEDAGEVTNQRHSRYLENFDVRKKYHENVPRKPKRQSISETQATGAAVEMAPLQKPRPTLPQPSPPSTAPSPSPPPPTAQQQQSRSPTPPQGMGGGGGMARSRSQSQSPVERNRQTPTKPPRTTTPTRRPSQQQQHSPTAALTAVAAAAAAPTITTTTTPPSPLPQSPPSVTATPPQLLKKYPQVTADRQSQHSTDEPVESSESERDSDMAGGGGSSSATTAVATDPKRRHLPRHVGLIEDHESTGLVSQESFDDELPYIPTTLPEERAQGVPIIPMKERANMELKTCPVDRPRSTTPLNPSHLEEYCGIVTPSEPSGHELVVGGGTGSGGGGGSVPVRGEKLRISLPRKDSTKEKAQNSKSPRRISNASGKSWFEFAEEGLRAATNALERKDSNKQLLANVAATTTTTTTTAVASTAATTTSDDAKTKLIAKSTVASTSTQRKLSGHWIDFENIPEKRKPAKRITTLPKEATQQSATPKGAASHHHQQHQHQHHHQHHHQHQQQQQPDITATITTTTTSTTIGDGNKLHYNYVKPEDCQCECHEVERESSGATGNDGSAAAAATMGAATAAAAAVGVGPPATSIGTGSGSTSAGSKSVTSVDLLQQGEDMLPLLEPDAHDGIEPSDSSREYSCYTDDEMDMPQRHRASSRSKSGSSKLDEFPRRDVPQHSPRSRKFPDNRK